MENFLTYHTGKNEDYFINQAGFRINTIPAGTKIKVLGFSLGFMSGIDMPDSEGTIFYKDGKTYFDLEKKFPKTVYHQESKFFSGDKLEIISLPE